jgi:phosphoribosyl-ATP pyrophosphohydrolase/phosphoribosyl-AMP cyclohydrolase/histidinol dehydrogenase
MEDGVTITTLGAFYFTVPKVDKICGPGNAYVTAAKMIVQNDSESAVAIDMPAGPSEVVLIQSFNVNSKL